MSLPVAVLAWSALLGGSVFVAVVGRRTRSVPFALVAGAFLLHYHVDGLATLARGSLYISKTYPQLPLSAGAGVTVLVLATAVLGIWGAGYAAVRARGGPRPVGPERSTIRLGVGVAALLPALVVVQRLAAEGLPGLLVANRQQVLTADLAGMVVFHLVPAAAALSFYGCVTARGWRRAAWAGLFAVYLGLALASGSRSSFLLNVLAPAGAFLVVAWRRRTAARARWSAGRTVTAAVVGAAVLGVVLVGSAAYRDLTRGDQRPETPLASPDLTQFDATAHLVAADLGPAPTYAAAGVVAVPRAVWADKPLSGNATLSSALFAERYETSRAEVTASVLGEAWLNARWAGVLVAAALLLLLVVAAERLLVTPGVATMLGCVVLFRGLNLVRSDLLNTVVPLAFAAVLFWLAARPAAHVARVARSRALAWQGGAR